MCTCARVCAYACVSMHACGCVAITCMFMSFEWAQYTHGGLGFWKNTIILVGVHSYEWLANLVLQQQNSYLVDRCACKNNHVLR